MLLAVQLIINLVLAVAAGVWRGRHPMWGRLALRTSLDVSRRRLRRRMRGVDWADHGAGETTEELDLIGVREAGLTQFPLFIRHHQDLM